MITTENRESKNLPKSAPFLLNNSSPKTNTTFFFKIKHLQIVGLPQPTKNLPQEPPEEEFEERYRNVVAALTEKQMNELHERFRTEELPKYPILRTSYERDGFESRPVQVVFQDFVLQQSDPHQ